MRMGLSTRRGSKPINQGRIQPLRAKSRSVSVLPDRRVLVEATYMRL